MPTARKWPYKANEMRENAIARQMEIERQAQEGLESARKRGDVDDILRLGRIIIDAQATKYELQLAYHAGVNS